MGRMLFLILIIASIVGLYHTFNLDDFTKENMEATIKKEKTIQAVQQGRERRRYEEQRVMDQF
jgi:Tfp pilus assembly protein PilO